MSGEATSTYGPLDFARDSGVSRETVSRVSKYIDLLREWNAHTNLVAESTLPDVWRRHVWDSAQLAPLIPSGAKTIVDLGSGAGFPGLVLALILQQTSASPLEGEAGTRGTRVTDGGPSPHAVAPHPSRGFAASHLPPQGGKGLDGGRGEVTVHLIESIQKKCRFLEAAIAATGANAQVHCARAEDVKNLKADVVTARAVAPLDRLLPLAYPFFKPATVALFLKGRSLNDELTRATKSWRLDATPIPSRSDPSGFVLRVTGLTPWRRARKPS